MQRDAMAARATLCLTVALFGVLLVSLPVASKLEQRISLDWLFRMRGAVEPPKDVVVVAIEEETARQRGVRYKPAFLSRDEHARLVKQLAHGGAELVAFDLTFDTQGRTSSEDEKFAKAVEDAGNVILVESLAREAHAVRDLEGAGLGEVTIDRRIPPIPPLDASAFGHAVFPLPSADQVDSFWTFREFEEPWPTLPVAAFLLHGLPYLSKYLQVWGDVAGGPEEAPPQNLESGTALHPDREVRSARSVIASRPLLAARIEAHLDGRVGRTFGRTEREALLRLNDLFAGAEQRYLNFYGPARTVTTVPYDEILAASDEAAPQRQPRLLRLHDLAGKAVFVGYSASTQPGQDGIRDSYPTVFSRSGELQLSGVEIAATAYANIRDGRLIRGMEIGSQAALAFLWGILLGIVCVGLRPACALLAMLGLIVGYYLIAVYLFEARAAWIPVFATTCSQPALALLGGTFVQFLETRRERELIKAAVGYYLPNSIVDHLAKNANNLGNASELVHGTCVATDAEKYTRLAETMTAAELGRFMNEYYGVLFAPVARRGGIISDVVGDAMLALWVSALANPESQHAACVAALEMVAGAEHFNACLFEDRRVRTRIGVHTGEMLLGNVGAGNHYEYRAVGDVVNTATRIQSLNKILGTTILLSDDAAAGLSGFVLRPLGIFLLAGKSRPIGISELVCHEQHVDVERQAFLSTFAEALKKYQEGQLLDAAGTFRKILAATPGDGPCRFYLGLCRADTAAASDWTAWSPIVRTDIK